MAEGKATGDSGGIGGDQGYAGIDIFRLHEAGCIVEHREVLQATPVTSAHSNRMF